MLLRILHGSGEVTEHTTFDRDVGFLQSALLHRGYEYPDTLARFDVFSFRSTGCEERAHCEAGITVEWPEGTFDGAATLVDLPEGQPFGRSAGSYIDNGAASGMVRFSVTPEVNAASTVLIVITLFLTALAMWLQNRSGQKAAELG